MASAIAASSFETAAAGSRVRLAPADSEQSHNRGGRLSAGVQCRVRRTRSLATKSTRTTSPGLRFGSRAAEFVGGMQLRGFLVRAVHEGVAGMKTQGEIEAAVCEGITRYMQDFMGRGPKEIRTYLICDLLLVRLQGILSAAETNLAAVLPAERGRDLLKSVRTHLVEASRDRLQQMIESTSGMACISMHHDVSTATGEEVFVFTLSEEPSLRTAKRK
jgi:uncharacterized protein YbcI